MSDNGASNMAFDIGVQLGPGWTARNEYWLEQCRERPRKRLKRSRAIEPLILCGHGVGLHIERGTLHIRNGFTHYPQERETFRFFRGDLNLPTRIIMLDGSGGISFDVLAWLAEQGVALVQITWRGDAIAVVGGSGYAGDAAKIAWQIATRNDPRKRLEFSTKLIREKIAGSITALGVLPPTASSARSLEKLVGELDVLATEPPPDVTALRVVEGRASSAYFAAWQDVPLSWKSTNRYPIPDDWRVIGSRSSVRTDKTPKNGRATHPLNAMLNYAYAATHSRLQIEAVAAGYDPTIGIMHHGGKGAPAYIFDLIEPERPKVDAAVLEFALAETFSGADFLIAADGTCRLAPQLARRVVGSAGSAAC
jgi:CRISP-associated protein Cas1